METIKVGIADDHPIVLMGVANILARHTDIEVLFSVGEIDLLLAKLVEEPVDVLLCDYEFEDDPQEDGFSLLKKIKRITSTTHVVFFSSHAQPHIISGALELGAAGFIGKNKSDFTNLDEAIRYVNTGNVYLPPSLSSVLLQQVFSRKKRLTGLDTLSERELAVIRMICEGASIAEIAERLCRRPKTISTQKNAAMKKLGAANDIELARIMRDLSP